MTHIIYLDSPEAPPGLLDALRNQESINQMLDFPVSRSVSEICLGINHIVGSEAAPLMVVATGARCRDLPIFARAQSAVHRSIISYGLIDPDFPPSTDQWPAAPVTVYLPVDQEPGRSISLRGFHINHFAGSIDLASQLIDQANLAQ